jgi:hypothetical protein
MKSKLVLLGLVAGVFKRVRHIAALLIFLLGLQCAQTYGQVVATWTDTTGDWSNASNWSTNPVVPNNSGGTTYKVIIAAPNSNVRLFFSGTINNLRLGSTDSLIIDEASLSLVSGTSLNRGTIRMTEAALINDSGARLINNGTITGCCFANVSNSGIFINDSLLSLLGDAGLGNTAGAHFINTGTITADSLGFFNAGKFDNSGTMNVSSVLDPSNLFNTGTFRNSGTINLDLSFPSSSFSNSGKFNNSGTITISADCFEEGCIIPISNTGTVNNSGTLNISGTSSSFTNSGSVIISRPGVFITSTNYTQAAGRTVVNGVLTASGGAMVNIQGGTLGGTGTINGNVMMAGTLKPGDAPGTLTIFGNYEQTSTGTFDELLSPSSHSLLDVNGEAILDHGTGLEIALLNGFNPIDQRFDIMNYSNLTGVFANGSSFWDDGFLWDVTYGPNQIDITAVQTPEPGSLLLLGAGLTGLVWRRFSIPPRRD